MKNLKVTIAVDGQKFNFFVDAELGCLLDIRENDKNDIVEYDDYTSYIAYKEEYGMGTYYEIKFEGVGEDVEFNNVIGAIRWISTDDNDNFDADFDDVKVKVTGTTKRQPTR